MSLFVAETEQTGLANIAQRFPASVIHVDDSQRIIWLWVPDMHSTLFEMNQASLHIWNSGLPGAAQPQSLAQLDLSLRYKGLVYLAIKPDTLRRNAHR
ncbi:MAG: hypothetical protein IPM55_19580 [Acidobacteria bacterium]|nr:hypothetical protein [Acidobacteriota bacterium]